VAKEILSLPGIEPRLSSSQPYFMGAIIYKFLPKRNNKNIENRGYYLKDDEMDATFSRHGCVRNAYKILVGKP